MPGQRGEPLVPLGVVLHRARPERVEVRVDRHVQRRQVRVVPDDVELAQLGQRRRRVGHGASGISSSSGRSGTSHARQDRRATGRRGWISKSRGGGSSLYMVTESFAVIGASVDVDDSPSRFDHRSTARRISLGQPVDLRLRPLLGHGDEDAVGQLGIPAAQGDARRGSRVGRPRRARSSASVADADDELLEERAGRRRATAPGPAPAARPRSGPCGSRARPPRAGPAGPTAAR